MQYLAICCNILRYLAILCIHYITLHCWKDIHNKLEICLAPCPSPCFYTATPSKKCQALQLQFWNRVALGITKHHLKPSQFQVYFISKLYKHTYCNPSFFRILSLFQNFRKMSLLQKRLSLIEKKYFNSQLIMFTCFSKFSLCRGPQSYCFPEIRIFAGMSAPDIFFTWDQKCLLFLTDVI